MRKLKHNTGAIIGYPETEPQQMAQSELEFPSYTDKRGTLYVFDPLTLPFSPARSFFIRPSKIGEIRGRHAHPRCHQILVAVSGKVQVDWVEHGKLQTQCLTSPEQGLVILAGTWSQQTYLEDHSTLLVFASEDYNPQEYVPFDKRDCHSLHTLS